MTCRLLRFALCALAVLLPLSASASSLDTVRSTLAAKDIDALDRAMTKVLTDPSDLAAIQTQRDTVALIATPHPEIKAVLESWAKTHPASVARKIADLRRREHVFWVSGGSEGNMSRSKRKRWRSSRIFSAYVEDVWPLYHENPKIVVLADLALSSHILLQALDAWTRNKLWVEAPEKLESMTWPGDVISDVMAFAPNYETLVLAANGVNGFALDMAEDWCDRYAARLLDGESPVETCVVDLIYHAEPDRLTRGAVAEILDSTHPVGHERARLLDVLEYREEVFDDDAENIVKWYQVLKDRGAHRDIQQRYVDKLSEWTDIAAFAEAEATDLKASKRTCRFR